MLFFNKKRKKIQEKELNGNNKIPVHVGIIMDGNGRWASRRGLPRSAGHRAGADNMREIVRAANEIGIKYLTVYAFSTENWSRPKDEVDNIMDLLLEFLKNADKEIGNNKIRIKIIGERNCLSEEIVREIDRITEKTKLNDGITLIIALNYGGRREIANAAKQLALKVKEGKLDPDDINEELVSKHLYTADIPDPDLIIRPSGEKRISNFLLWQSSYAEFWFSDVLWPDFSKKDLMEAIEVYQKRDRRFGGR